MKQTVGRLWVRYFEVRRSLDAAGDGQQQVEVERAESLLRDRLLVNYSPLVKYVAGRVGGRMAGPLELEDAMSWGIMGLLNAIETFDPDRGVKFESYAMAKIRWSILDELRRTGRVPRRVRSHVQESEGVKARMSQRLRRSPSEEELAREMDVSVEWHRSMLAQYSRAAVGSLEARAELGDGAGSEYGEMVADTAAADPQTEIEKAEVRDRLVGALESLAERERLVATFYFYEGLTLKEIGKAMNLTEGRISQILRGALEKLRKNLSDGTPFPVV